MVTNKKSSPFRVYVIFFGFPSPRAPASDEVFNDPRRRPAAAMASRPRRPAAPTASRPRRPAAFGRHRTASPGRPSTGSGPFWPIGPRSGSTTASSPPLPPSCIGPKGQQKSGRHRADRRTRGRAETRSIEEAEGHEWPTPQREGRRRRRAGVGRGTGQAGEVDSGREQGDITTFP